MDKMTCTLCPRACQLGEGQIGSCSARIAQSGTVSALKPGVLSAIHIDPVEKKPLYHFYPGRRVLSLGGYGCNLMCRGCQNASISRSCVNDVHGTKWDVKDLIELAAKHSCQLMAYTYNEPIVWHEFASECAHAARDAGMKNIMVTAGYVTAQWRERIFSMMDAANVDLKGFSRSFYRHWANAELDPVLETIEFLHQLPGFWLELTTLIIPGQNDDRSMLEAEFSWIVDHLGCEVPIHLSAFHPAWKASHLESTPIETLRMAQKLAKEAGIHHVYLGNVPQNADTLCPKCGKILISRWGYQIDASGITENKCQYCGACLPGVF